MLTGIPEQFEDLSPKVSEDEETSIPQPTYNQPRPSIQKGLQPPLDLPNDEMACDVKLRKASG